jgi:hypothetical protein
LRDRHTASLENDLLAPASGPVRGFDPAAELPHLASDRDTSQASIKSTVGKRDSNMAGTHSGKCFCGAVHVEVTGEPEAMGFCHCESCRSWSASPVNAFVLWKSDRVKITQGAEHVGTYNRTEMSYRKFCRLCGGHIMTDHPGFGMMDVYAATTPGHTFTPHLHVYYSEKVLPIPDGLPKFKDFPAEFGGSGEQGPE